MEYCIQFPLFFILLKRFLVDTATKTLKPKHELYNAIKKTFLLP